MSEFFSGAWFVLYSSGIICTEYAKYKCKCWAGAVSRRAVSFLRETRSETAAGEDAAANYESECFSSMIKRVGTKLANTNVYYIKLFQAIAYSSDITSDNGDLETFLEIIRTTWHLLARNTARASLLSCPNTPAA